MMSDDDLTWAERWSNLKQIWGFEDKPPVVESVTGGEMLPTAGVNDDGGGWSWNERQNAYQREVHAGRPRDPENWIEHSPGVWHRKAGR